MEVEFKGDEILVNLGPQHPASHGVLRVFLKTDGEIISDCDVHIGMLHRCAEKIAENRTFLQFLPYTDRFDYLASINNNVGWTLTVEKALGVEVPRRAQLIRMIVCELNRIASHLVGLGIFGIDIGAFTPVLHMWREREIIVALLDELCGARLTYSYDRIGGVSADAPEGWFDGVLEFTEEFEKRAPEYDRLLSFNEIFVRRTVNVGLISAEDAIDWGLTGPNLRGSGVDWDLRRDEPYLLYDEVDFNVCTAGEEKGVVGDSWNRYYVRVKECHESIKIIRACVEKIKDTVAGEIMSPGVKKMIKPPAGEVYVRVENPRGELGYYLVTDGSTSAYRAKIRGPSFCNIAILNEAGRGEMIADFVALIGSLDIVMGEVDR